MRRWLAGSVLGFLLACSGASRPEEMRSDVAANDLTTSIEVETGRDTINFVLHLTNSGTQPLVLEFNSAQRYDFEVRTPAGAEVWRWSSDRLFGQMMGSETIPAGDSREFRESWVPGGRTGMFVAIGRVVASNRPVEQRANFEIR